MIVRELTWLTLLFTLRGSVLHKIGIRLVVDVAIAVGVTLLFHYKILTVSITPLPFTLIGLALGIFLGFRNNTSYDRFWEGRKLWGSLVNTTRSFARQMQTLVGPQPGDADVDGADGKLVETRRELTYRCIAYVHAFRMHLRDQWRPEELRALLPDEELAALEHEHNRPIAMLKRTGDRMREVWAAGWVNAYHMGQIEQTLGKLTDIQGACERIKSTPIPFSYTVLIHRLVGFYCFALPFGIVHTVHLMTPLVVALISFAFFGLDAIGDEIEQPFGEQDNDLPLSALSRMIEVNLRQTLGEAPDTLPPLLTPDEQGYLS